LSQDLPESKITTTTTDKEVFKYLSQTRYVLFGFEKKLLNEQWAQAGK